MNKQIPNIDFPFFTYKEVSSPEFNLNIKSNSPGNILYRSSNESVAKINEYGWVSTVCAGNTNIYVTQLETEEFEGLELCKILYVGKSEQKEILEEVINDNLSLVTEIKKEFGAKPFFDIKISLNSNLNVFIELLNTDFFDFRPIGKNIFRIFPRRVGVGSISLSANGNNCYNPFQKVIPITIIEKEGLVAIDLKFSMFTEEVKHDALDEFTIITSNSGQQQTDNTLILQTTLDSKIGNGYARDIGLINVNPSKLINIVESSIGCCNQFNIAKDVYSIDSDSSNIFIGGAFTIFDNFIANRFAKLDKDLNVSLNSNSDSFTPLNVNTFPLQIYALNTNLFNSNSEISNIRYQNFTDKTFDISWDPTFGAEHYIITIRQPTYKHQLLSGYNNRIVNETYLRVTGVESKIGEFAPRYNIKVTPISGLITGKTAYSYTYGKINPPFLCVFPSDTTALAEWSSVIPISEDKIQSLILKGPNGTIYDSGPYKKGLYGQFINLVPNTTYELILKTFVFIGRVQTTVSKFFTTLLTNTREITFENITDNSFKVKWLPVEGANGYVIEVGFDSNFLKVVNNFNNLFVNNTELIVTGLAQSTNYWVRVRALNSINQPGKAEIASVNTITIYPPIVIPDDVTVSIPINQDPPYIGSYNLQFFGRYVATRQPQQVEVFTNVNGYLQFERIPNISNYLVSISDNENFSQIISQGTTFSSSNLETYSYEFNVGKNYYIKIQGIFNNITGESSTVTLQTIPQIPLFEKVYLPGSNNVIAGFHRATGVTKNSFFATWAPTSGAKSYILSLSKNYSFSDIIPEYFNIQTNNNYYQITGLDEGSLVYMRIRASNDAGLSYDDAINQVVLTKPAPPTYFNYSFDIQSQVLSFYWNRISGVDDDSVREANRTIDINQGIEPVYPWPTLSNWEYSQGKYIIELYEDPQLTQFAGRHVESMPYTPPPTIPNTILNTGYSTNLFEKNGQLIQLSFDEMYYARLCGVNMYGTGEYSPILEVNTLF